jgi:hypothetical protein
MALLFWNRGMKIRVAPQDEQITCACVGTALMIWSASSPQL